MTDDAGGRGFRPIDDDVALDGNAIAGLLASVFGEDLTDTTGRCARCGTMSAIGVLRAYTGPDWILRCPACSAVVVRIADRGGKTVIDVVGLLDSPIGDRG